MNQTFEHLTETETETETRTGTGKFVAKLCMNCNNEFVGNNCMKCIDHPSSDTILESDIIPLNQIKKVRKAHKRNLNPNKTCKVCKIVDIKSNFTGRYCTKKCYRQKIKTLYWANKSLLNDIRKPDNHTFRRAKKLSMTIEQQSGIIDIYHD